ncbi:MAG: tetratricopeptide repeat protein [Planctomycetaceae bacterium]|nr:tetratricopeptide repeat protein [Planctomycetaceae bacterium]
MSIVSSLLRSLRVVLTCIALTSSVSVALAQSPGQAELDQATDLKLDADSIEKLGKVIELCKQAIEKGLNDGDKELAKQLISSSAFEQAERITQRLAQGRLTPRTLARQRDEAMAALDLAIENNEKFPEAWILKAKLYTLPEANQAKAIEAVSKAIDLLGEKPTELAAAYLLRAQLVTEPNDKLADIAKATEADPANINAWQLRLALLDGLKKHDEAYKVALDFIEREPDNLVALEVAVRALASLDKVDEGIDFLSKQIEKNPKNSNAYRMRGQLLVTQKKLDEAVADLTKALEINAKDPLALMLRGEIYMDQKKLEEARTDIDSALLIEPGLIQGILLRSLVAANEKRYSDAIADMRKLVRAQPDNPAWMLQLASYYQLDNRPRMSIKVSEEVIKKDEKNWRAHRLRGDALLSVGEHKEAINDYEKAAALLEELKKQADAAKTEAGDKPETPPADATAETETEDATPDTGAEDNSDLAGILNNLAWVLATSPKDDIRNGKRSVELGLRACELTSYKEAHILSTLAAGYAESGDMPNAIKWAEKAVQAGEAESSEQTDQLKQELDSYKAGKPWREEQKQEENAAPVGSADRGIDT